MAAYLTYSELLIAATDLWGPQNYIRYAIAREKFAEALIDNVTIWVTTTEGFGIALGSNASALDAWARFTLPRAISAPEGALVRGTWDFYARELNPAPTVSGPRAAASDEAIALFLKEHSPDASVSPGDPEILSWVAITDHSPEDLPEKSEEIVAVGAIVRWQSGELCLASIATHTSQRGKGLATRLVTKMVDRCAELGAGRVGLGVYAENFAAKRVYQKCGFAQVNEFTSYSRAAENPAEIPAEIPAEY